MNDQTAKLLEDLGNKLGTTAEHLWSVLVRQAPISSTIDVIVMIGFVVAWVAMYKTHKRLMMPLTKEESEVDYSKNLYDRYDMSAIFPMTIGFAVLLILSIGMMIGSPITIAGFFNPEYWALHEILHTIGH